MTWRASNAILDSAEAIAAEELAQRRIRLLDPTRIAVARADIAERFGGIARCDAVIVS